MQKKRTRTNTGRMFSPGDKDNNPQTAIKYHQTGKHTGNLHYDENNLVICVDGACSNNGSTTHQPVASFGVYFGPDSRFNRSGLLPPDAPQTSQSAEIYAVSVALGMFHCRMKKEEFSDIERVIVVTDSAYVEGSMTKWVYGWIRNGWKTAERTEVKNKSRLRKVHAMMNTLEKRGITVQLWKVGRNFNADADELAKAALEACVYTMR